MRGPLLRPIVRLPYLISWGQKVTDRRRTPIRSLHTTVDAQGWQADLSLVDCSHYDPIRPNYGEKDAPPVVVYPNVIDEKEQELLEQTILTQSSRYVLLDVIQG